METTKFYFHHTTSGFYAGEIYAKSKKQAITQYKKEFNLKRLPHGFEIWR